MEASEAKELLKGLPETWGPRREQPSWDRDFSGRAEIAKEFGSNSQRAVQWVVEACAFSKIVKEGYSDDPQGLAKVGRDSRAIIKQAQNKNGK